MGTQKITETYTTSEEANVHYCDFCGRSEDIVDGEFHDMLVDPTVTISYKYRDADVDTSDVTDGFTVKNAMVRRDDLTFEEPGKHYCDLCYHAHMEVHNDDN